MPVWEDRSPSFTRTLDNHTSRVRRERTAHGERWIINVRRRLSAQVVAICQIDSLRESIRRRYNDLTRARSRAWAPSTRETRVMCCQLFGQDLRARADAAGRVGPAAFLAPHGFASTSRKGAGDNRHA